ncbi:hypothetical protein FE697_017165 [Mumia zhuanghuii]|uniref:Fibronectin type-III domain-containing protein n=2 Tax=Mumia TaxID=1546255 RepID=A0ABW1QPG8_9ACTN|nr:MULTISPECIES: hypothetical protein [Mumia]KAA1420673.1 hypothetical protein FE697_017165 [Mumia zhuanghuii]
MNRTIHAIGLLASAALVGGTLVAATPASADNVNVAPVRRVTGLSTPEGIARDAAGNVYVADLSSNSVKVYAPNANGAAAPLRTLVGTPGLVSPYGLDIDANGYLFVGCSDGTVRVFAPGAKDADPPVQTIPTGAGDVRGIDVSATDQLYVRKPSEIKVYGPTGAIQRTVTGVPSGYPIAVASDGVTWTGGAGRLLAYGPQANGAAAPLRDVQGSNTGIPAGNYPEGLAFDRQGRLYATVYPADVLLVFSGQVNGNVAPLRTLSGVAAQLTGPTGITVGRDNRIFVSLAQGSDAWAEYRALFAPPAPPKPAVKVPGKPRALKVAGARAAKKRTIRWRVPASNGGVKITGYRLVIKKGSRTLLVKNLAAGKRSYKVKRAKLRNGKHVVLVKAKNSKGYGKNAKKAFRVRK